MASKNQIKNSYQRDIMSTYDAAISLMKELSDNDLLIAEEFMKKLTSKSEMVKESSNPFHPMTREEIIEQLAKAHELADKGLVLEAHKASKNIREKYGL